MLRLTAQRLATRAKVTPAAFSSMATCGVVTPKSAEKVSDNKCAVGTCSHFSCRAIHSKAKAVEKDVFTTRSFSLEAHSTKAFSKVGDVYPGAKTNVEFVEMLSNELEKAGYDLSKVLVATSLCCDEVNRPLEAELSQKFTWNFNMGGLAGFPFGGKTSFGAMAAHIPDGGSCLVVYGPHVGIDSTGAVGTVERRGKAHGGSCCGSAIAASGFVGEALKSGGADKVLKTPIDDVLDAQQSFVNALLTPYAQQLEDAGEKRMEELPKALYQAQSEFMKRIIDEAAPAVGEGTIALVGGIQINTPEEYSDYFLPNVFSIYDNQGNLVKEILK